jgi:hypothetical protein
LAEGTIASLVDRDATWAQLLMDAASKAGRSVHVSVMIDDYSGPIDTACMAEITDLIVGQFAARGVHIDHVALESECVAGAERLLRQLFPPPPDDPVGTGESPLDARPGLPGPWLANEDASPNAPRAVAQPEADPFADPDDVPAVGGPSSGEGADDGGTDPSPGGHAIHLDVELWSGAAGDRRWACPTLAACWQLARLGALRDHADRPLRLGVPANSLHDLWTGDDRYSPMPAARETLTILAPRMQKVEHAVRTVLSRVVIPGDWCTHLRSPQEHLDRIGYIFPTAQALPTP